MAKNVIPLKRGLSAEAAFPGCGDVVFPKFPPQRYTFDKSGDEGEIYLYGVIGSVFDGISASQFATDLKALGAVKNINIYINSPGGFVMEGRAIYSRLKAHAARKIVHVDSEASSIASLIAMSGTTIKMAEGALMLVHRAWTFCIGNAVDFRAAAADMDTVDKTLVDTYVARTGMKASAVLSLMDEDRYMSADEAVKLGFADEAEQASKVAAMTFDRRLFNLPQIPSSSSTPRKLAALAQLAALKRK